MHFDASWLKVAGMRVGLVLSVLLVWVNVVLAESKYQSSASSSGQEVLQGYRNFKDKEFFTYEKLEALIKDGKLKTVEEVLPVLKKAHPDFFENYVLMYRSKSLQRASFLQPRVLLFDVSGRIVVTFNGDPTDKTGYNKLEIMQFRDKTQSFEFREIAFEKNGPKFSESNPQKCLRCHQSPDRKNVDPRPNWEPYSVWPGAYGSMAGSLNPMQVYRKNTFTEEDLLHVEEQAQEVTMMKRFLTEIQPKDPRYSTLGLVHRIDVAKPDTFKVIGEKTVDLTDVLGRVNALRVVRIMTQEYKDHWSHLESSVYGVIQCGKAYMDDETYRWHRGHVPREFIAHPPKAAPMTEHQEKVQIVRELLTEDRGITPAEAEKIAENMIARRKAARLYPDVSISEGLWLLYTPLGISIEDWSMDFQTQGRFAFNERFGLPSNPADAYRYALRKSSPSPRTTLCAEIAEKSVTDLRSYRNSALFKATLEAKRKLESERKPLIQRCISCHAEDSISSGAPEIPFNDENALIRWLTPKNLENVRYRLSDHATLEEQMPRGLGRPSREERRSLIHYLEGLVN